MDTYSAAHDGRVVILGAGASRPAGYPLASELLGAVESLARKGTFSQLKQAWQKWEEFRSELPEQVRLVTYNSNPEVVLSLPDLMVAAAEAEDTARFSTAISAYDESGESHAEELEDYHASDERKALDTARGARGRFVRCLEWYFSSKHHADRERGREARNYLRRVLGVLAPGDVVVTLNWDTLAERTLAEDRRWNPRDGYGFERQLLVRARRGWSRLSPEVAGDSEITVLKLHGSYGWRRLGADVYYDSALFLREFGFQLADSYVELRDEAEPTTATDPALLAYPSFLKRMDHPVLDGIWRDAAAALSQARRVDVWGYSLPPSDGAIRALLQPFSHNVRAGETTARIHDPSKVVLARWGAFLGENAELSKEKL